MARLPRFPDLLTTANLGCGVASILLASQGQLTIACGLVFAAALFDVFDGLAARALGGGTPLGAQLDSLADMVSFGVAPAMIAAIDPEAALQHQLNCHREVIPFAFTPFLGPNYLMAILVASVISIASCWRLAKFNLDTRQTTGFLGLATPANALFWISVALVGAGAHIHPGPFAEALHGHILDLANSQVAKLLAALILAILMLSELPLPSLKFKHKGWKGNEVIFLLIGIGAVLVLLYGILAVPLILITYLLSPLWGKLFPKTT